MLNLFKVKGFKNFEKEIIFDFNVQENYEFAHSCIENNNVKMGIIYGDNSVGKSNLGAAIFDIVANITDKSTSATLYDPYLNLDMEENYAEFYYKFKFDAGIVEYSYRKVSHEKIIYENLLINNKLVVKYDYEKGLGIIKLKGAEALNRNLFNKHISFVKYVFRNTNLDKRNTDNKLFYKFFEFVEKMLFFRSMSDGNTYIGFTNGSAKISEAIISEGKLEDFQEFLGNLSIQYKLLPDPSSNKKIFCEFKKNKVNLFSVASNGTKALSLFYYWYARLDEASFVFIDEFDAYYHSNISREIVKLLLRFNNLQCILTTHNTDIMSTELLRPDCYFILNNGKIKPINQLTDKEIRYSHNLQKMYKAGAFEE